MRGATSAKTAASLESALVRLYGLAGRLEQLSPTVTHEAVLEARRFALVVHFEDEAAAVADTLEVCSHLQRLLLVIEPDPFERMRLIA